jgi:hypothetical protein
VNSSSEGYKVGCVTVSWVSTYKKTSNDVMWNNDGNMCDEVREKI